MEGMKIKRIMAKMERLTSLVRWMEEEQRELNCYSEAVDMSQDASLRKKYQSAYDLSFRKWYRHQQDAIELAMKLTGKCKDNALAFIASNKAEIFAGDYDWTE